MSPVRNTGRGRGDSPLHLEQFFYVGNISMVQYHVLREFERPLYGA